MTNCERPKCDAFEFGKCHRRSNKVNTINNNPMKEKDINKYNLMTRQIVSADNYISHAPSRIYNTKGKSDPSDMFSGGFFVLTSSVVM